MKATAYLYIHILLKAYHREDSPLPYVMLDPEGAERPLANLDVTRAVCKGLPCLLETNIPLLPPDMVHTSNNVMDMLLVEHTNKKILGESRTNHYISHPLSTAIDGDTSTFFESLTCKQLLLSWNTQ